MAGFQRFFLLLCWGETVIGAYKCTFYDKFNGSAFQVLVLYCDGRIDA